MEKMSFTPGTILITINLKIKFLFAFGFYGFMGNLNEIKM